MNIAVIGAGNMGSALVKGWCLAGADIRLTVTAKTQRTLDRIGVEMPSVSVTLDNAAAVKDADVVGIAVKPWLVDDVLSQMGDALGEATVISVAAGARNPRIDVYAMPNIAAAVCKSMSFVEAVSADAPASRKERVEQAVSLLSLVGKVQVVDSIRMSAGLMMAGCGIAYVMRFLRAMTEGGVEMGFYPGEAQQIAMQTMEGAVALLETTGMHPEVAIDKVTTPGGVTIKGLNELDHAGFNSAVIRCLKAGLK